MVAGRFFVEAIDLTIDSDLHKLNRDRDERAFLATEGFLGEFGIDPNSRRLAQALRSIRTMDREKASDRDKAEAFSKLVPSLIGQPTERILDLIHKLEMTVGRIDRDLFAERTRLSTISTVTRPLATKWLERWNSQDRPDFNFDVAMRQANSLLLEEIDTPDQLRAWLGKAYEMFTELVVYRGPTKTFQMGSASRPAGMVGESNERVYRRNWFSFVDEHLADLMQKAKQLANGDSKSAYSSSYSSASLATSYAPVQTQESQLNAFSAVTTAASTRIQVTIESASVKAATASREWLNKNSMISEVSAWATMIADLWGDSGREINVSISVEGPNGPSSIAIPSKSPSAAADSAISFVKVSA
jgi:hypothetical protein